MLLRYRFGGNRPSQTDPLTLSQSRIHGLQLDIQVIKGGISLMTPPPLARRLQSLPPILHMNTRIPISDYSKGSQGLSVLLQVSGIFTGITTSPSSTSEFRYLRTVIVTADIHRGFISPLRIAADGSI